MILLYIESTKRHKIIIKFYRSWFDENDVPIVMDNVKCNRNDENISDCGAIFSTHNCDHREKIWLHCQGK